MGGKNFNFEVTSADDPPSRKDNGIYCSPAMIVFVIIAVCVLIAATALMVFYIPDRSINQVATKPPVTQDPTTKAVIIPTDSAPSATMSPSDLMEGRLPNTVLPRRYEVNLRPFLYDDDVPDSKLGERFTFDGWVRIKVECIEPTDEITLHSKNITIHGMPKVHSVSTLDKTDIFESYEMVEEYAFMVLKLKQMLRPHEEYDIYMEYSGILWNDDSGFYLSKYVNSLNNTRSVQIFLTVKSLRYINMFKGCRLHKV